MAGPDYCTLSLIKPRRPAAQDGGSSGCTGRYTSSANGSVTSSSGRPQLSLSPASCPGRDSLPGRSDLDRAGPDRANPDQRAAGPLATARRACLNHGYRDGSQHRTRGNARQQHPVMRPLPGPGHSTHRQARHHRQRGAHLNLLPDGHSGGRSPSNRLAADSPVSSSTCTYRAVVRRSAWPSRCITAFGFSPASISHEACVCRTW